MCKFLFKGYQILKIYNFDCKSSIILTSPHSGQFYPDFYKKNLSSSFDCCRSIEDMFVDEIIYDVRKLGISLLINNYSRAVFDVNRDISELDRSLINLHDDFETSETLKVKSGIGLIPIQTPMGIIKFKKKFSNTEFNFLINMIYRNWHRKLDQLIQLKKKELNRAFIIDCHSMPSDLSGNFKIPDIVLGNCDNKSCNTKALNFLKNEFEKKGYSVSLNYPYSGGFITQNYYNHKASTQTVQIEINKKLYLDEQKFKKNQNFNNLKNNFLGIIEKFSKIFDDQKKETFAAE